MRYECMPAPWLGHTCVYEQAHVNANVHVNVHENVHVNVHVNEHVYEHVYEHVNGMRDHLRLLTPHV